MKNIFISMVILATFATLFAGCQTSDDDISGEASNKAVAEYLSVSCSKERLGITNCYAPESKMYECKKVSGKFKWMPTLEVCPPQLTDPKKCIDNDYNGENETANPSDDNNLFLTAGTATRESETKTDSCQDADLLIEASCSSDDQLVAQDISCKGFNNEKGSYICKDSACYATCSDTDGIGYDLQGTTTLNSGRTPTVMKDICANNYILTEYYCDNGKILSRSIDCRDPDPNGVGDGQTNTCAQPCADGHCVSVNYC
jgi:hypothetical protein